MRFLESILKLLFVIGAVYFLATNLFWSTLFVIFLVTCFLLGLVLIFNKKASYRFKQSRNDFTMRKVEGVLLVLFAVIIGIVILA